jgi:hypothetical protein
MKKVDRTIADPPLLEAGNGDSPRSHGERGG